VGVILHPGTPSEIPNDNDGGAHQCDRRV